MTGIKSVTLGEICAENKDVLNDSQKSFDSESSGKCKLLYAIRNPKHVLKFDISVF